MGNSKKIISAKIIREYARVCAAHNRLEKMRYKMRSDLLTQLDDGAIPSTAGPFILVRSFQARIDAKKWSWKMFAMELAIKYFAAIGESDVVSRAMELIVDAELQAKRKNVDVLSAKPNPRENL